MELEEIQATWAQMSQELEKQKKLTNQIIMQMTQERYRNKFNKISVFETIGAIICFGAAVFIFINFNKLNTWYLVLCGIFTLFFLIVLPILVLRSLQEIRHLNILKNNYKDTLVRYLKAKKKVLLLQQLGIYMSFVQLFAVAAVFSKIMSGKDFFMVERDVWSYVFILGSVLFILFFARWGYRGYKNITNSAENIIRELE